MQQQHDFTKGNILKQLVYFSAPIMVTNLLQVSYQFTDSLWVGNLLGGNALGAIAVSSTIIFTLLSFIIGLNNTTLTILSQQKAKGNTDRLKTYVNAFIFTLTLLGVALGTIGVFAADVIIEWLQTPASMRESAVIYLQINAAGILFLLGYNFIGTALRAVGDSKTPLRFVLLAVILNILFDPLFISGFDLGVTGAAYATIGSQGIAFIYGIIHIIRKKQIPLTIPFVPAWKEVKLILNLGIPSGLQMAVISAGSAAIMSVVNGQGENIVAGFSAAKRLDSLFILPAQALGTAMNSMAGQNIGVQQWERVRKIAKYGLIYNLIVMGVVLVFVFFISELAIRLFIQTPESVAFGKEFLRVIAFFYPFLGVNFVLNGIVRAAGAMYQVLALNLISFWVLRFPLTYLLTKLVGDQGIALGMGISFLISSVLAYSYYRFGKWKEKRLFQDT